MTEAEWLSGEVSFDELLRSRVEVSERKVRLFLCACVRQVWRLLDEVGRSVVEATERCADGMLTEYRLARTCAPLWGRRLLGVVRPAEDAVSLAANVPLTRQEVVLATDAACAARVQEIERLVIQELARPEEVIAAEKTARRVQQQYFRDIVGNPFRVHPLDPAWLVWNGGLVRNVAQAIYEERRFADMPVLGDALDDAGCDRADVLEHCHGPGPHVRGCWVLDLILGKE